MAITRKILFIDDDNMISLSIRMRLSALIDEYYFIAKANGQEGVDCFSKSKGIELIIIDYQIPVMNGLDAIKKIRELSTSVRIIMMSGEDIEKKALDAGANIFIEKPFSCDLLMIVKEQLDLYGVGEYEL